MFFPEFPDFSVPAPIVKLKLVQVFKKFLVKFGLQFKGKTREQLCRFRFEQSGFLQGLKVLDDSSKGQVEAGESFVNASLLGNINCSHESPFKEGDLWSGLRRCLSHWRGPSLCLYSRGESGRNKKAKRFEETHKVKRRIYFVKRRFCSGQTKSAADLR